MSPAINNAQHSHEGDSNHTGHHTDLHFVHPLFTESVSPDTKIRLDYLLQNPGSNKETELEGEYAFSRFFSVEAGIHYEPEINKFGNTHLLFKFSNYTFADGGILLGYGLSIDLPTGSGGGHGTFGTHGREQTDHHHDENIYQFSPFFNAGIKAGNLELVGWSLFHIPTNHAHPEDATTGLEYNLSALYHVSFRFQPLLELTGTRQLSGVTIGSNPINVAPGLRVKLLKDKPLVLGLGLLLPVSQERNFDSQIKASAFYHF